MRSWRWASSISNSTILYLLFLVHSKHRYIFLYSLGVTHRNILMQRILFQQYTFKCTLCKTDCFEKMSNCTVRKDCECTATDVKIVAKSYNSPRQQCKRRWKNLCWYVRKQGTEYYTIRYTVLGAECNATDHVVRHITCCNLFFYFDGG